LLHVELLVKSSKDAIRFFSPRRSTPDSDSSTSDSTPESSSPDSSPEKATGTTVSSDTVVTLSYLNQRLEESDLKHDGKYASKEEVGLIRGTIIAGRTRMNAMEEQIQENASVGLSNTQHLREHDAQFKVVRSDLDDTDAYVATLSLNNGMTRCKVDHLSNLLDNLSIKVSKIEDSMPEWADWMVAVGQKLAEIEKDKSALPPQALANDRSLAEAAGKRGSSEQ
jgi:hypothetical protein